MEDNRDLSPTDKQIRLLIRLGVPTQRRRFITNRAASRLIGRLLAEQYREHERRQAERSALEQSRNVEAASAIKRLQELEERQREAEWEEIQKRFAVVVEESSNADMGDVQSASQRIND